jgi:uncharacterized protein YjbI with pentapeptide repeats
MANDKHVALLKNGAESWNSWRQENASERADLIGADLTGADLPKTNLISANLN